eukprot:54079-Amorphochlora_amoeboformis.AAC.1
MRYQTFSPLESHRNFSPIRKIEIKQSAEDMRDMVGRRGVLETRAVELFEKMSDPFAVYEQKSKAEKKARKETEDIHAENEADGQWGRVKK